MGADESKLNPDLEVDSEIEDEADEIYYDSSDSEISELRLIRRKLPAESKLSVEEEPINEEESEVQEPEEDVAAETLSETLEDSNANGNDNLDTTEEEPVRDVPSMNFDNNLREPAERESSSFTSVMNEGYGDKDTCRRDVCDCDTQIKDDQKNMRNRCDDYNRFRSISRDRGYFGKEFVRTPCETYNDPIRNVNKEYGGYGNQVDNCRSNEDFRSTCGSRINEDKRNRKFCPAQCNPHNRSRSNTPSCLDIVKRNRSDIYSRNDRFPHSSSYVYSDSKGFNNAYGSKGDHLKNRAYDDSSDNELQDTANELCRCLYDNNKRTTYRRCNCCECECNYQSDPYYRCDDDCNYSISGNENYYLPYQHRGKYPELVDELEESITQRNKERFLKSMRRFEMLSRKNGSVDRSFMVDDDDECICPKPQTAKSREQSFTPLRPPRTGSLDRSRSNEAKQDCPHKKITFKPLPKCSGYVEKLVKCMDPNIPPEPVPNYNKPKKTNTRWELDPRSGEWYKICDRGFDFEQSFPPLPPAPCRNEMCPCDRGMMKPHDSRDYHNMPRHSKKYMPSCQSKQCMCACCCREKRY